MINIQKLESDAFRLKDLESLRSLFADLNFEYEDKPVDKQNWNQEQREIVVESGIVARKDSYLVYYIKTNSDSIKVWKEIATKIISSNNGLCLVCSHNPSGFQWIFSSISKEFSKSFTETRHIPIEIKPNLGIPKPFLEFIESIKVEDTDKGINVLRRISDAFDKFSLEIHDELTINVFEAIKVLSEGIVSSNNLILSNETLEEIREPVFNLLYRIIFVLYAEDKSIFIVENPIYHDQFSLKWIKNNWILKSDSLGKLRLNEVQSRLKNLFRLIEVGSEDLDYDPKEFFMRPYYGRLFDRKINMKLDKWLIPNQNYLKAIELLTTTMDKKRNRFFLDYAALEIRHLGSIYERLLEFHLTVNKGKIADLPSPTERKSSGSYYTPEYIVDYIVTNSIGPLIDDTIKSFESKSEQIDAILSLNILDPAMGSGHFLVGAIEYLAKRICEIENKVDSIQNYVERKRDVVRRCVYGVDLNPLAVDLAALSLWLETISSEKPLSFLSAHLKVGNSLIGSVIEDIFEKQTTLLESEKGRDRFKKNVQEFLMFENLEDDSSSAVKTKIEKYSKMQSKGTIYYDLKFLLDSKLAKLFGIKVPALGDYRAKVGENSIDFYTSEVGEKIKQLSEKNAFFHWDLEFPDIFFDEKGNKKSDAGFDAVIGNPPYINIYYLSKDQIKVDYYKQTYESAYKKFDLYVLFIEKSIKLLKEGHYASFIISEKFLSQPYGYELRKFILQTCQIIKIANLVDLKIFSDAKVDTIIIVLKKQKSERIRNSTEIIISTPIYADTGLKLDCISNKINQSVFVNDNDHLFRLSINQDKMNLKNKIQKGSVFLKDICYVNWGARSGDIQTYVVKKSLNQLCKPMLDGRDIDRYRIKWDNKFLIYDKDKLYNPMFEELFENNKLLIRDVNARQGLRATFDDKCYYAEHTLSLCLLYYQLEKVSRRGLRISNDQILLSRDFDLKYILGIINSDLITFYFLTFISSGLHVYPDNIRALPIKKIPKSEQQEIVKLVNKLLFLNEKLDHFGKDKDQTKKIQDEIIEANFDLNMCVFKIYEIHNEEQKIIKETKL